MPNQSVIIGGKEIQLVTPKSDCSIASRQPGGKYHRPNTNWWTGEELIALDSSIFQQGAFTDHVGASMVSAGGGFGGNGTLPALAGQTDLPFDGEGIRLQAAGFIATAVGSMLPTVLSEDFTFDFWIKDTVVKSGRPLFYPLLAYPSIAAGGSWPNRMLFGGGTGEVGNGPTSSLSLWNNDQYPRTWGAWTHNLNGTAWKHVALTYSKASGQSTLYVAGVRRGVLNFTLLPLTGNMQLGIGSSPDQSTLANHSIVERIRLRAGVHFTGASIDLNSIY